MAFKFVAFATLVAAASAGLLPEAPKAYRVAHAAPLPYTHGAPLAYHVPVEKVLAKSNEPEPFDHNPKYSYSYEVHDPHTGDIKTQQETRNGDVVEGSYSFIEADGSRRIVHYTADAHHGFNAVVERQPAVGKHVEPARPKIAHPVTYTPVAYQHTTPIVKVVKAAPAHPVHGYAAPAQPAHGYTAPAQPAHGYRAPAVSHSYYH